MAELLLKVKDGANYRDGDVISAYNNRRVDLLHLDMLVDHRLSGFDSEGLRPRDWRFDCLNMLYSKRLIRLNRTQAMVQELTVEGLVKSESLVPSREMDVEEYFRRRKCHHSHRVYGLPGREVYHGGKSRRGAETTALVWDQINKATGHLRGQDCWCGRHHGLVPWGRYDLRFHLAIRTDDFSDEWASELVRSTETQKRVHNIQWKDRILGTIRRTAKQVESPRYRIGIKRPVMRTSLNHEPMEVAA